MQVSLSGTKIEAVDKWLDDGIAITEYRFQPLAQDWARISKVIEELGEAIQAFIGYTGQNPRKGTTNTIDPVLEELADTALTAIFAIQHFTKDSDATAVILADKLELIAARAE